MREGGGDWGEEEGGMGVRVRARVVVTRVLTRRAAVFRQHIRGCLLLVSATFVEAVCRCARLEAGLATWRETVEDTLRHAVAGLQLVFVRHDALLTRVCANMSSEKTGITARLKHSKV